MKRGKGVKSENDYTAKYTLVNVECREPNPDIGSRN